MTTAIAKTNYTHDAMIELIIANPQISQKEIAGHFGYTQGWVSRIIRADSFREAVALRKKELVDPVVLQSIETRFEALVLESLEILQEKLQDNPTVDIALRTAELGAKALGYGAKNAGAGTNINFVVAMPGKAATADEWLAGRVIEGQVTSG